MDVTLYERSPLRLFAARCKMCSTSIKGCAKRLTLRQSWLLNVVSWQPLPVRVITCPHRAGQACLAIMWAASGHLSICLSQGNHVCVRSSPGRRNAPLQQGWLQPIITLNYLQMVSLVAILEQSVAISGQASSSWSRTAIIQEPTMTELSNMQYFSAGN